jgi:Tol biopolymer transport system component
MTGDLAIRDLAAGESRRLTDKGSWFESIEFALFSKFSPDGRWIAYNWFNGELRFDLRVIAAEGGEPEVVYDNPQLQYVDVLDWTPDGEGLVILLRRPDRSNQMALLTLADGAVRVLRTFDWRYPERARVSPDGRWIVYDLQPDEDDPDRRDIFVLATDASVETPLVQHPARDVPFGWTPDGRHLVFGSDRTGSAGAWLVAVEGGRGAGRPLLIKADLLRPLPMGITREGALFYGVQSGHKDVYLATVDFATGRTLEPPTKAVERFVGSNFQPDWSPDGKYLAYLSRRGPVPVGATSNTLVIRAVATGEERVLTPHLNQIARPRWSPDGASILVSGADRKNRQGLYLVSAQTGEVTPLVQAEPGAYVLQPEWAPDGRTVYYLERAPAERRLRIVALDRGSGATRELYVARPDAFNVYWLTLSPDGQQLAFQQFAPGGVSAHVVPTSGGAPREVGRFTQSPVMMLLGWTPDGSSLVFLRIDDPEDVSAKPTLWVMPIAGGEPRKLDLAERLPQEALRGQPSPLRVHPDGRRVVFSAGQDRSEVWVMEGFAPQEDEDLAGTPPGGGTR